MEVAADFVQAGVDVAQAATARADGVGVSDGASSAIIADLDDQPIYRLPENKFYTRCLRVFENFPKHFASAHDDFAAHGGRNSSGGKWGNHLHRSLNASRFERICGKVLQHLHEAVGAARLR